MLPIGKRTAPWSRIVMLGAAILFCHTLQAQESYDSIAHRYKNEHAVITDHNEHLVITYEDGKLVANSYVTEKKLMISDLAPGMYNREYVFHSSTFNKLTDIDAYIYTPGKKEYEKKEVNAMKDVRADGDFVFYDDNKVRVVFYSGLQKGSVTEVRYAMEYSDEHLLPRFSFQESLPIVRASFEVTAPKYVDMSFVLKGENTSWIKQTKEETATTITYKFTASDIPAYKQLDNVPSLAYYIPHVIPYITSYKRYGEGKTILVSANPDELYKHLYKYIQRVNMNDDTLITNTVAKITKNDHSQREKAAHIYRWVQKNIHYIAFEDGLEGFVPREAKDICKRKYGDCKDMTSILVAMYRKAGLPAYFTWVGTTDLPYTNEETPLPLVNNHMICALHLDNEWIFADGTHPTCPFGINRHDIQGKEAMIAIDSTHYKIINVPELAASKSNVTDTTYLTVGDNQVTGSLSRQLSGYDAWELQFMLRYYKNEDRDKYIRKFIERGSDKFLPAQYDIATSDSESKDMLITSRFTIEDYGQKVGKQYYINMNLNRRFLDKQINVKDRHNVPYYNKYKGKTTEVVVLNIPKGYKVKHLPPAAQGSVDGLWSYSITYKADKERVTLIKEYVMNTIAIKPQQFADNNKLVDALKNAYKESVVFSTN